MLLINDTLIQIILLFFLSFALPKQKFYIIFKNKPNIIIKNFISTLDFISRGNFKYKSINFFRSSYPFLSDQRSINSICNYYKNKFKDGERYGGQIYIENELRSFNWQNSVIDEIFKYFFYEKFKEENNIKSLNKSSYQLLKKIRNIERLFESRLITIKSTLHYFFLILGELLIVKIKIKNSKNRKKENIKIISSLSIHDFNLNKANQSQDLVIEAINLISKDYNFKNIFQERKFISHLIGSNPDSYNIKLILKMIIITLNLIKQFFCSNRFLEKSSKLIDSFTKLISQKIILSSDFKILIIDPVQGPSLPFLSTFIEKGHQVYFTSFSLGNCHTKSCSDYNGTFSRVLSPHIGLTNLTRKSGFNGKIIQTKCYLTNANKLLLRDKNNILKKDKKINIIIPESSPNWIFSLSEKESFEFIEMLYFLNLKIEMNIFVKKKRLQSHIEDHLNLKFPENKIKFLPPVRGLMTDFSNKDFIISSGISSLGIKASELFNTPYIIYDTSNNSINEWKNIYFNAKLKPEFTRNASEVKNLLNEFKTIKN